MPEIESITDPLVRKQLELDDPNVAALWAQSVNAGRMQGWPDSDIVRVMKMLFYVYRGRGSQRQILEHLGLSYSGSNKNWIHNWGSVIGTAYAGLASCQKTGRPSTTKDALELAIEESAGQGKLANDKIGPIKRRRLLRALGMFFDFDLAAILEHLGLERNDENTEWLRGFFEAIDLEDTSDDEDEQAITAEEEQPVDVSATETDDAVTSASPPAGGLSDQELEIVKSLRGARRMSQGDPPYSPSDKILAIQLLAKYYAASGGINRRILEHLDLSEASDNKRWLTYWLRAAGVHQVEGKDVRPGVKATPGKHINQLAQYKPTVDEAINFYPRSDKDLMDAYTHMCSIEEHAVESSLELPASCKYARIVLVGDTHIGDAKCDILRLRALVSWIEKEPWVWWIGMGDYFDNKTSQSPGFDEFWPKLTPGLSLRVGINVFQPIAHKCLALYTGNHDTRLGKAGRVYFDLTRQLSEALDLTDKFMGFDGFVLLRVKQGKLEQSYDGFISHGATGARTPGGRANFAYALARAQRADFMAMGHVHNKTSHLDTYRFVDKETGKIQFAETPIVVSGSFQRPFSNTYGSAKAYPPGSQGAAAVDLYVDRHSVHPRT